MSTFLSEKGDTVSTEYIPSEQEVISKLFMKPMYRCEYDTMIAHQDDRVCVAYVGGFLTATGICALMSAVIYGVLDGAAPWYWVSTMGGLAVLAGVVRYTYRALR